MPGKIRENTKNNNIYPTLTITSPNNIPCRRTSSSPVIPSIPLPIPSLVTPFPLIRCPLPHPPQTNNSTPPPSNPTASHVAAPPPCRSSPPSPSQFDSPSHLPPTPALSMSPPPPNQQSGDRLPPPRRQVPKLSVSNNVLTCERGVGRYLPSPRVLCGNVAYRRHSNRFSTADDAYYCHHESSPMRTLLAVAASLLRVRCLPTPPPTAAANLLWAAACLPFHHSQQEESGGKGKEGDIYATKNKTVVADAMPSIDISVPSRYSDINKKSKSHYKYFHCAGKKCFADINEEETKLQDVKITHPSSSSTSSIATTDDIYSQVFGKDRPGRVRGVGTGSTLISLWGTSSQCQVQLRVENAHLNAMVKELAERLGKVESIVVEYH
ncbi:hypothetical protein Taro_034889 [Colocasia esculenta]|uniref:Uncharacterized protein n=1 Tax=Colocasia esculenta TaxID=4460 RepID=A0A843W262_COLES|nr:hypothetical protein [Colocasia esculenta]